MLFTTVALSTLAFVPASFAHFTLDYPPTRGFDEDIEPQFCGGFNKTSAQRTLYSLGNTSMTIDSHHNLATVSVLISFAQNPTSFSDFSNGTETAPYVKNFFQVPQGRQCFWIDISSALSSRAIANGTEATLMVRYDGGDSDLWQCSDVVLLTDYATPSNETCSSGSSVVNGPSSSSAATPTSSSGSSSAASVTSGLPAQLGTVPVWILLSTAVLVIAL